MDTMVIPTIVQKGLVYKKEAAVNWCNECGTVLANEQVIDGKCWRCDSVVEKNTYLNGSSKLQIMLMCCLKI